MQRTVLRLAADKLSEPIPERSRALIRPRLPSPVKALYGAAWRIKLSCGL